jgi:hypothetical protein
MLRDLGHTGTSGSRIRLILVVPKDVEITDRMPFVNSEGEVIPQSVVDPLSASSGASDSAAIPIAKVAPFYSARIIEREQQGFFSTKWSHDVIMPTSSVLAAIRARQQIRRIHTLAHTIKKIFK